MPLTVKPDPGPCPVDDCPHTTCVSPDYALTYIVLPARDGVSPRSRTFTTATYTRRRFREAVDATKDDR